MKKSEFKRLKELCAKFYALPFCEQIKLLKDSSDSEKDFLFFLFGGDFNTFLNIPYFGFRLFSALSEIKDIGIDFLPSDNDIGTETSLTKIIKYNSKYYGLTYDLTSYSYDELCEVNELHAITKTITEYVRI